MKKLNPETVFTLRDQYKEAREIIDAHNYEPRVRALLDYEACLWERKIDATIRDGDVKKGVLPKVVDFTAFKIVKENMKKKEKELNNHGKD